MCLHPPSWMIIIITINIQDHLPLLGSFQQLSAVTLLSEAPLTACTSMHHVCPFLTSRTHKRVWTFWLVRTATWQDLHLIRVILWPLLFLYLENIPTFLWLAGLSPTVSTHRNFGSFHFTFLPLLTMKEISSTGLEQPGLLSPQRLERKVKQTIYSTQKS